MPPLTHYNTLSQISKYNTIRFVFTFSVLETKLLAQATKKLLKSQQFKLHDPENYTFMPSMKR